MLASIIKLINSFGRKLRDDFINAFSAQAAFFIFISFFPFVMFLFTLIQYLPIEKSTVLSICTQVFPSSINSTIITIVDELYSKASGTILSVTVVATLWSASKGFLAIVKGLNSVYNHKETRNYFVLRFWSAIYTLTFAIIIVIFLVIFVFGNQVYIWSMKRFPLLSDFALIIISLRTVVGFGILIVFFLTIYKVIPNRSSKVIAELPGAIIASAGWVGFSYLYGFYIDNMKTLSYTYGSLTAIVLCMIWLYSCMKIMFIGAEINALLSNPTIRETFSHLITIRRRIRKEKKAKNHK